MPRASPAGLWGQSGGQGPRTHHGTLSTWAARLERGWRSTLPLAFFPQGFQGQPGFPGPPVSADTKPALSVCSQSGRGRPGGLRVGLGRGGRKAREEERPGWSGLIPGTGTRRARPPGWAPAAQQPGSQKYASCNSKALSGGRRKWSSFPAVFIPACSFVGLGSAWIPRQSWSTWPTRPPSGEGEQDPQVGHTHRSEPCSS